jgi:hypothetical protein
MLKVLSHDGNVNRNWSLSHFSKKSTLQSLTNQNSHISFLRNQSLHPWPTVISFRENFQNVRTNFKKPSPFRDPKISHRKFQIISWRIIGQSSPVDSECERIKLCKKVFGWLYIEGGARDHLQTQSKGDKTKVWGEGMHSSVYWHSWGLKNQGHLWNWLRRHQSWSQNLPSKS